MEDKICFKCQRALSISEFYVHRGMADGHLGKCKDCTKRDVRKHRTENIEAYNLYLKGRYHGYRYTREDIAKSKKYFEQAIDADPNYALAWYGLAIFYYSLYSSGSMPPKAAQLRSRQALCSAWIDPRSPFAWRVSALNPHACER